MISAFKVFLRSIGDVWFNLIGYSVCNLIAAVGVFFIPVGISSVFLQLGINNLYALLPLVVTLFILGAPLLLGLLQVSTEALRYNERPEAGAMVRFARENFRQAWKLALIQIAGTLVIFVAVYFYLVIGQAWSLPLVFVTAAVGWTWLGVVIFSGPLLLRSSDQGMRMALRNGLVATLHYPFFSATLIFLSLLVLILSIAAFPLMALITLSFYAVLATRATNWVLQEEGVLPRPQPAEETE